MNILDFLVVYDFDDKIRLGVKGDGGYVIGKLDGSYDCYISAGVSNEESFTSKFLSKYKLKSSVNYAFDGTIEAYPSQYTKDITFIKKNINNVNDDKNTNLLELIDAYNNIFLKMDIEGGEYNWLLWISEAQLNKFKQIVIEFHGIANRDIAKEGSWEYLYESFKTYEDKLKCLEKLSKTHYIIHAHGNNSGKVLEKIPNIIELTYVNKNYFKTQPKLNNSPLPDPYLDFQNAYWNKEVDLNFYPFVSMK